MGGRGANQPIQGTDLGGGAEIPRKQPSGLGLGLCGRTSSDVTGRPNEKPLQAFC